MAILSFFEKLYYSFPVQLLLLNLKKNQILLLFWVILFGFVTRSMGSLFGIPYLLLHPEYMDKVDFRSFFILGASLGGFTMAFNITGYIMDGRKFRFLGALKYPFSKYCVNNSLIPVAFIITYFVCFTNFQLSYEKAVPVQVFKEWLGFLSGFTLMLLGVFSYFRLTNKDIFKILSKNVDNQLRKNKIRRVNVMKDIRRFKAGDEQNVRYYLELPLRIAEKPKKILFMPENISKVFGQNHLNAVMLQLLAFVTLLVIGFFKESPYFRIPAGASAILFFTIILMFFGAFSHWLKGWGGTAFILLIIVFNILIKYNIIGRDNMAFGINYHTKKTEYSLDHIREICPDSVCNDDISTTKTILNNWRNKFDATTKPKMVFVCVSGGGLRSAVWTMQVLQTANSALNDKLSEHTFLITGASGGMIGAAYFRELYLRQKSGADIRLQDEKYPENISRDNLNSVIFSLLANDLFIGFQKYNDGKYTYTKDRGYAWEQQLSSNTNGVLDKRIGDYKEAEQQALIPMLIIAPTVVNDGRKLFISPQPISYMSRITLKKENDLGTTPKGIEFTRLFKDQDAENLNFLSALRMNATVPYITPNVVLPSDPQMEIMDAGLSDNFGIDDAIRFIYIFRKWIEENTSGVVLISVRDTEKNKAVPETRSRSVSQKIITPVSNLYKNWANMQDIQNDKKITYVSESMSVNTDLINFEYIPEDENERAALSWHLTSGEKEDIRGSINKPKNQAALNRLTELLKNNRFKH